MDIGQLMSQAWDLIKGFGAMDSSTKIMSIVMLLIAVWKSSLAQPLWAKLGKLQILVAPALAVVVSLLSIHPFTMAALWMSLVGGGLAVATHELLDAAKSIPGLGAMYVSLIGFAMQLLGSPKSVAAAQPKVELATK